MRAKFNRLKRGFTLVELMIVVAIVGILAALAIYGVSKYVKNAKTAEARDALGRMAKDATTAYQKEGMASAVLSLGGTATAAYRLCVSATAVPANVPSAAKYQSSPDDWNQIGWNCLKFSMNDPQYYQYNYTTDGTNFSCIASGDLDGDGAASTFRMLGQVATSAGGKKTAVYAPNIQETDPDE